jgi:NitT/TauT family transport system ATP-binding protein
MQPAVASMPEIISIRGASKRFFVQGKEVEALKPTALHVKRQEFVALVGPSGCGKSTCLNLIAGLLRPTAGEVRYHDKPVAGPNRSVGYMTQKDTLLPWRTAADNIAIALELRCRSVARSELRDRVAEMIKLVGLTGFEQHYPAQLSGGMRKRVALARTLIYEPETLLMDEPFGALDAQLKLVMQDQLQRLTSERQITVVFVTHDLGEAITLADRVVVFSRRPARVAHEQRVDLPRPRDVAQVRFTGRFHEIYNAIWEKLREEYVEEKL